MTDGALLCYQSTSYYHNLERIYFKFVFLIWFVKYLITKFLDYHSIITKWIIRFQFLYFFFINNTLFECIGCLSFRNWFIVIFRNQSTSALIERTPSRWPRPEWRAPWKNYRVGWNIFYNVSFVNICIKTRSLEQSSLGVLYIIFMFLKTGS